MALPFLKSLQFHESLWRLGPQRLDLFFILPAVQGRPGPKPRNRGERLDGGRRPGGATGFSREGLKS